MSSHRLFRRRLWVVLMTLGLTACGDDPQSHGDSHHDGGPNPGDGDGDDSGDGDGHEQLDATPGDNPDSSPPRGDDASTQEHDSGTDSGPCTGDCPPACTDSCASAGLVRCEQSAVSTCQVAADGCLTWSTPVACDANQVCMGSSCGSCTEGTPQCTAQGDVEVCNAAGSAYLFAHDCQQGCASGLCLGVCKANEKRCQDGNVAKCNEALSGWTVVDTCSHGCDQLSATCALATLDVTANMSLDGEVVVTGTVYVRAGKTLSVPSGALRLRAKNIVVEAGGSIVVAPNGTTGASFANSGPCGGVGGSNATSGEMPDTTEGLCLLDTPMPQAPTTPSNDPTIKGGSRGGNGGSSGTATPGLGGLGGGRLELIADSIEIAGLVSANGQTGGTGTLGNADVATGGGGGSGGGMLLAADQLTISGTVSVAGGAGGTALGANASVSLTSAAGGKGGDGFIKLLYGSSYTKTGTIVGGRASGLMPPLKITSSTFPDPTLYYNDDVSAVDFSWNRPFPGVQDYVYRLDVVSSTIPTNEDEHTPSEHLSFPIDAFGIPSGSGPVITISDGVYLHVASRYGDKAGTFASHYLVGINRAAPKLTSAGNSYSSDTDRTSITVQWAYPRADKYFKGLRWVIDHYGDTVPALSDKDETQGDPGFPLPKTLYVNGIPSGLWALHAVTIDQQGVRTKKAAHLVFRAGPNPGSAALSGVVSHNGTPVVGATVRINRDLVAPAETTTNQGAYDFGEVSAGKWEIEVSAPGYATTTSSVTITSGVPKTLNLTL